MRDGKHAVRADDLRAQLSIYGNTEDSIRGLMKEFPNSIEVMVRWIELAADRKDFTEAVRRARLTREQFPKQAVGYIKEAEALLRCDVKAAADGVLQIALKKLGRTAALVNALAQIAHETADYLSAAEYFAELRMLDPAGRDGFIRGASAEAALGHHDIAEKLLHEAVEGPIASDHDITLARYARYAHDRADWAEAARRWKLLCDRRPFYFDAYIARSESLRHLARWTEASHLLESADVLFPENARVAIEAQYVAERQTIRAQL